MLFIYFLFLDRRNVFLVNVFYYSTYYCDIHFLINYTLKLLCITTPCYMDVTIISNKLLLLSYIYIYIYININDFYILLALHNFKKYT